MIDISVIVPVYNVQKYLEKALNSILTASNRNIEIICIDDGSTDASPCILDKYEMNDKRIRVIHKMNEGYGKTMNLGIDIAKGRYIAILEPDDYIEGDMYGDLLKIADDFELDYVKSNYCSFEYVDKKLHKWPVKIINNHDELFDRVLHKDEIDYLFYGAIGHWTGLYKKEFLDKNNIRFSETPGASYQDQGFWFQSIVFANRVYLSKNSYYRYRQDNPLSSMNNIKKLYLISDEYDILFDKLLQTGMLSSYLPYYMMSRFSCHKYTIRRLSYDLKYDFIMRMSKDFNKYQDIGILDESRMYKNDRLYLHEIMEDPKKVYERLLKVPDYIHKLTAGFKSFYLFGAGVRAKRIMDNLRSDDIGKLKGILVTSLGGNLESIMGVKVNELRNVTIKNSDAIIIGTTLKFRDEIVDELCSYGIKNIIEIPSEYC